MHQHLLDEKRLYTQSVQARIEAQELVTIEARFVLLVTGDAPEALALLEQAMAMLWSKNGIPIVEPED